MEDLANAVSASDIALQVQLLLLLRTAIFTEFQHAALTGLSAETGFIGASPMFIQTLLSGTVCLTLGLLQSPAKNVLFYWLEFITSCVPYFGTNLPAIVGPVFKALAQIIAAFDLDSVYDSVSAKDIVILLKALSFMTSYCLQPEEKERPVTPVERPATPSKNSAAERMQKGVQKVAEPFVFVFGQFNQFGNLVKDMITGGDQDFAKAPPSKEAKRVIIHEFPHLLRAFIRLWGEKSDSKRGPRRSHIIPKLDEGTTINRYQIQDLIVGMLDHLIRHSPRKLVKLLSTVWDCLVLRSATNEVLLDMLTQTEGAEEQVLISASVGILCKPRQNRARKSDRASMQFKLQPHAQIVLHFLNYYVETCYNVNRLAAASTSLLQLIREADLIDNQEGRLSTYTYISKVWATFALRGAAASLKTKRTEGTDLLLRLFEATTILLLHERGGEGRVNDIAGIADILLPTVELIFDERDPRILGCLSSILRACQSHMRERFVREVSPIALVASLRSAER